MVVDIVQTPRPQKPTAEQRSNRNGQDHTARDNPFQSNIPDGDLASGCIQILFAGTLLLQGAVEKHVMFHMAYAEPWNPSVVHEAVQQVAQKLRDGDRRGHANRDMCQSTHVPSWSLEPGPHVAKNREFQLPRNLSVPPTFLTKCWWGLRPSCLFLEQHHRPEPKLSMAWARPVPKRRGDKTERQMAS